MGSRRVSKVGPITIHEYADETNELVAKSGRLNRAVAGTWTVTGCMDELVCLQKQTADNSRTRTHASVPADSRVIMCTLRIHECVHFRESRRAYTSSRIHPSVFANMKTSLALITHTVVHSSFNVTFFFHDYAGGVFKRITESWRYKRFMKVKVVRKPGDDIGNRTGHPWNQGRDSSQ